MSSSNWYSNPDAVVEQFRKSTASRGAAPVIVGYDDFTEVRRGGQGVVYAATQQSTGRRVAIKLLLEGAYATDVNRRRFEREIDLVGSLRNPNIVRIYDSGVSGDGFPYFVMEYVDGAPLDQFVSQTGLSSAGGDARKTKTSESKSRIDRLLKLFLPICDAVQYAYQRGVIHRDLKPANIRVDSDGSPRVLDFGLARLQSVSGGAESSPSEMTGLTVSGQFMGSVPWSSPEHAAGNPDAIDTRSDIYSLGVVLYQLLTGRFPYSVTGTLRDILDAIQHLDPVPPGELDAAIDKDLETIVLKCLAKEPVRRYQSAADLAADVRRYLAGESIEARRDSTIYTMRKLLRRYRWAAAAGGVILVLIVTGLFVSLNLWRKAERQRTLAESESKRADAQRKIAEQRSNQYGEVNDFLTNMLAAVEDPIGGKDVRVADILDKAAETADRELADEPQTQRAVRIAIGGSYFSLGQYDKADAQFSAALQIVQAYLQRDTAEYVEVLEWMGHLRQRQGRLAEAEELTRTALEYHQRTDGPEHSKTLSCAHTLATILADAGRLDESEAMERETLAARLRVFGEDNRQTLTCMSSLAGLLRQRGHLEEAQSLYEKILERRKQVLGARHIDTITSMTDLAGILSARGEPKRAEELIVETYALANEEFGEEHPRTIVILKNLALVRKDLNRPEEAIELLTKALATEIRVLGPDHPDLLATKSNLGSALRAVGRFEEAEPYFHEAVETATETLGPDHPNTLNFINNYANLLLNMKRPEEAETRLRQGFADAVRKLGESHWLTATVQGNLGLALMMQKRFEEAEMNLLAALRVMNESFGEKHYRTTGAADDLVMLYEAWGKPDLAAQYRKLSGKE